MAYKRAIVVEDHADLRDYFCDALKLEQVDAVGFGSVDEACDYLDHCDSPQIPNMALVDFSLGEKTGAQLIGKIRSTPGISDMKIIMISGWQDAALHAKAMGADGFIRKPFDFDELWNLLNSLEPRTA